jgi:hypothetical protein
LGVGQQVGGIPIAWQLEDLGLWSRGLRFRHSISLRTACTCRDNRVCVRFHVPVPLTTSPFCCAHDEFRFIGEGWYRTLDSPELRDLGSVMDEEEQTSDTAELAMNGQGYKSICTFGVRVRLGR